MDSHFLTPTNLKDEFHFRLYFQFFSSMTLWSANCEPKMNLSADLSPKSKSENEIYQKTEMYTISTIPQEILKSSGYVFDFTIPVIRNGIENLDQKAYEP